jgi:predicted ATPase
MNRAILMQEPELGIVAPKAPATTNLPVPSTPFVGRERELADLGESLRTPEIRLLTLTGPGGIGKTRLALALAERALPHFQHGVHFVDLAALTEPELLLSSIAETLGVPERPSNPISETLAEFVRDDDLLLLLDNVEQVASGAGGLAVLLSTCPRLRLLVTSREPLHLAAEREYQVSPLSEIDAVALFTERALTVRRDWTADDEAVRICQRLDCLPLALELAAARVNVLAPAQMLARLDRRLPLLTGGPRDAPERQRTLEGAIGWSYDLLSPPEQQAFGRLSTFSGGCTLEAAEDVCEAGVDTLQSLVEKSLLWREGERYLMLETIREYASQRLDQAGEASAFGRRHAQWFLELLEGASPSSREEQIAWLGRLELEHANFRAALGRALDEQDYLLFISLAVGLSEFWQARGHLLEGRRWLDSCLIDGGRVPAALRARALNEASTIAYRAGDLSAAGTLAQTQLEACREVDDQLGVVQALVKLAKLASDMGEDEEADRIHAEARAVAVETTDRRALLILATAYGNILLRRGNFDKAADSFSESLELAEEAGRQESVATCLFNLGLAEVLRGRADDARLWLSQALELFRELADLEGIAYVLVALASLAARTSPQVAALALGSADALLRDAGASLEPVEATLRDAIAIEVAGELGQGAFDQAVHIGQEVELDEALITAEEIIEQPSESRER